jgi:hypothetical protein
MSTFTSRTVTASQLGTIVEIGIRGYGGIKLDPAEARELGKWLITVQVPEVKPERGREINLKEAKAAPNPVKGSNTWS